MTMEQTKKDNTILKINSESFEDIILRTRVHEWVIQDTDSLRVFPLSNIRSSKIKLKKPISVFIGRNDSETIINCPDLDLYGVGDSEQEAIMDLSESIEELYFILKKNELSKLGPHMLNMWEFLRDIVLEINAIKNKRGRKNL